MTGEHRDPVTEAAEAVLRRLVRLDAQMEAEGFTKSARLRAVGDVLELALRGAVETGVLSIGAVEPYDTGDDDSTVNG